VTPLSAVKPLLPFMNIGAWVCPDDGDE